MKRYPELQNPVCAFCKERPAELQLPHCTWGFCDPCRLETVRKAEEELPVVQALVQAGGEPVAALWGLEARRRDYREARRIPRLWTKGS